MSEIIPDNVIFLTTELCKDIYKQEKSLTLSKELRFVEQLNSSAQRTRNYLKKITWSHKKDWQKSEEHDAFAVRYTLANDKKKFSHVLLSRLTPKLDGLIKDLDELVEDTEKMKERIISFKGMEVKLIENNALIIVDILAELYEWLEDKKPTQGKIAYESKFERFAQDILDDIERDTKKDDRIKLSSYTRNMEKKNWQNMGYVKDIILHLYPRMYPTD